MKVQELIDLLKTFPPDADARLFVPGVEPFVNYARANLWHPVTGARLGYIIGPSGRFVRKMPKLPRHGKEQVPGLIVSLETDA
jgi:hypothetical protein